MDEIVRFIIKVNTRYKQFLIWLPVGEVLVIDGPFFFMLTMAPLRGGSGLGYLHFIVTIFSWRFLG
jgi:hypothetical protein